MHLRSMLAVVMVVGAGSVWGQGSYYPTQTEINLGPIPLDNYFAANGTQMPSCGSSYTIQQCIKLFFNNNPSVQPYSSNNYIAQGVTGVRFMFAVQGGTGASTAWDSLGNVRSQWVMNLQAFLSDLHSYGIIRVTPTPQINGGWGGSYITPPSPIYDCTGQTPLVFYPWVPYGFMSTNSYSPDCFEINEGYNIANSNPYFWGWSPLFNLVNQLFNAVYSAGLQLGELDLTNELDMLNWTVQGRLIFDNKHYADGSTPGSTDVLGSLRGYASNYGFNPYSITFSISAQNPTGSGSADCGSIYGDSARLLEESELIASYAGTWSAIGFPSSFSVSNGLLCGGDSVGMIEMPLTYSQPQVTDIHAYTCVLNSNGQCDTSQDATATATVTFSDLWGFLTYRQMTGNTAMIGETFSNQSCEGMTPALASQTVSGYEASNLYASDSNLTIMRPWNNVDNACYVAPNVINPPFDSTP